MLASFSLSYFETGEKFRLFCLRIACLSRPYVSLLLEMLFVASLIGDKLSSIGCNLANTLELTAIVNRHG